MPDKEHIINRIRDLWEELRGEQLFITGGADFFGCWLLENFLWTNDHLQLGASATVLRRFPVTFTAGMPNLASTQSIRSFKRHLIR